MSFASLAVEKCMYVRESLNSTFCIDCFFAIVFPENLQQNSNKFADGIPWNLHLQIYNFIGRSSMHA